jgi:hypothetical protein
MGILHKNFIVNDIDYVGDPLNRTGLFSRILVTFAHKVMKVPIF